MMIMRISLLLLFLFSFLSFYNLFVYIVDARQEYQSRIPNGNNVKDENGDPWPGVGHENPGGGGSRNPFGVDFQNAGFQWTQSLCQKDSDGDGVSNGAELGDPDCEWSVGKTPRSSAYITNPGIPEGQKTTRIDSCANYTLPAGSRSIDIVFPSYKVPKDKTTYAKMGFKLDELLTPQSTSDLWLVKFTPKIQNVNVVHHILIYSCTENQVKKNGDVDYSLGPSGEGGMPCSGLVYAWAVGAGPFCMPAQMAMKIKKATPWVMMEIHYDNPSESSDFVDSSGITISVVESTVANANSLTFKEAAYVWIGASLDEVYIPPYQSYWEVEAVAKLSKAAQYIPDEGLKVFAYFQHGHKYAKKHWTTIDSPRRASTFDVACNSRYDFNYQEIYPIAEPFRIYKDDILTAHCTFSNPNSFPIYGGEGSDNEMCIHFLLAEAAGVELKALQSGSNVRSSAAPLKSETGDTIVCGTKEIVSTGAPKWIWAHGIMMIFGWGIILPTGALFPVFLKNSKRLEWFKWHRRLQGFGSLLVIIAGIVSLSSVTVHLGSYHAFFGIFVFFLLPIHLFIAIIRPHNPSDGDTKTCLRKTWEFVHAFLGRAILVIAGYTIALGLGMLGLYTGNTRLASGFGSFFFYFSIILALISGSYSIYTRFFVKQSKVDGKIDNQIPIATAI